MVETQPKYKSPEFTKMIGDSLEESSKEYGISKEEIVKAITGYDFLSEEEFAKLKESEDKHKIVWLEDEFWNSWGKVKGHLKKELRHNKSDIDENVDWKFYAHDKDSIKGKPQLIEQVQKRIPLVRQAIKTKKEKGKEEIEVQWFFCFDDKYDKRYDGYQKDSFALDFWMYKVISEEGKEYFLLSQVQFPNETCEFKGMAVEMDDFAEMSRSMKVKSLSRIFFVKEFEADIKTIPPEELINLTKEKNITIEEWMEALACHPNGKLNRFPEEFENLRSAFILAGKEDGYPLHLGVMGKTGTRKTMGIIETTAYKFAEEPQICEGGNSRMKGLSPSFKEKPANLGYLAKAERVGFIDEIGKMVELESQKHQSEISNILGELNFLLEHKSRIVGSGNDNDCRVQANAKFMFVTNPVGSKQTIFSHIGLIDPTMMSRILWWVQDEKEIEFVLSDKGIVPPTHMQYISSINKNKNHFNKQASDGLDMCRGDLTRDLFLTIFDSCYVFTSKVDKQKVEELVKITTTLSGKMKDVWKPRAYHHIKLLIDGLVKQRCLFKDYDNSFEAKQEDYDLAERILIRMVNGWNTKFLTQDNYYSDVELQNTRRRFNS